MNTIDRDGPPDGDFARYVERLSGAAGRTPGRVESPLARVGGGAASRGSGAKGAAGKGAKGAARTAAAAGPAGAPGAGAAAGRAAVAGAASVEGLRAAARALGLRLSRWLMIGGIALIVLAILDLVPAMTPLPGFALLLLSIVLRNLSTR
ncbi:MAG: hypothetical protein M9907_10610 [Burkholderiaceae bacterium]|nr:hypothetical protein [Burkholderiaceae bacterium]